jgi:carboxyl-terminal processing protease
MAAFSFAQQASVVPVPDSVYYDRLFYLCKAWGFAKYHHTGIAAGNINWDDELFKAIHGAKYAPTNEGFNDSVQLILENAGPMAISSDTLPYVPDSLNYNDFSWMEEDIFTDTVRSLLDTIRSRFRPRFNVYYNSTGWSVNLETDQLYYLESDYPSEDKRLLALFRYWNIIEYFFPCKNLMDQDWDTTLAEFIPGIVEASDALSYTLTFRQLTTRLNDTHGYFISPTYQTWNGTCYPPFTADYVENEMVVTKVLEGNPDIGVGDVIKAIDGVDIYDLRDSLRIYVHGSNDPVIERGLNYMILLGAAGPAQVVLDDGSGLDTVDFTRNSSNYLNIFLPSLPMWTDTITDGCHFGIVNIDTLVDTWVPEMFDALWETDAIIFDLRRYPRGSINSIAKYLYPEEVEIAKMQRIGSYYPGTYKWMTDFMGGGMPETYDGEVIILFNEATLSQGEMTCMGFEPYPELIKIGSQTAGADGNVAIVYLPGRIRTIFTGLGVYYPDYTQTQRIGIVPDYEVHRTIAGIRAGIDELMAFALNCALLDVKEIEYTDDVSVYPNPFVDHLFYEIQGNGTDQSFQLEIFDLYGRRMAGFEKNSSTGEIELPGLASGIYFMRINSDRKHFTTKIIKY